MTHRMDLKNQIDQSRKVKALTAAVSRLHQFINNKETARAELSIDYYLSMSVSQTWHLPESLKTLWTEGQTEYEKINRKNRKV